MAASNQGNWRSIRSLNADMINEMLFLQCKTLGLLLGLSMTPLLLVEPENAPNIESIENLAVEPSKLALETSTGIVEDYVRWGII